MNLQNFAFCNNLLHGHVLLFLSQLPVCVRGSVKEAMEEGHLINELVK